MENGIQVLRQDTETTFDDRDLPVERVRITFKVDGFGPFIERFDKATFSGVLVRQRLEAFAQEVRVVRGS